MVDICFAFKLNLNAQAINLYVQKTSEQKDWEYLKKIVIPNLFKSIFTINKEIDNYSIFKMNQPSIEEMKSSPEYKNMIDKCNNLISEYFEVVASHPDNKGILWPDSYLNSTKVNARRSIWQFLNKYPFVKASLEDVEDELVNKEFRHLGDYGHGKSAMILFNKIDYVLNTGAITSFANTFFFYDKKNEYILVPTEYGDAMAAEMAKNIEDFVNSSNENFIGDVTIIPLFDQLELGKIRKGTAVHVNIVYPNGPTDSQEIDEILRNKQIMNNLAAQEQQQSFFPKKDETINGTELSKQIEPLVKKGYVQGVYAGKRNILKGTQKKVFDVLRLFEDFMNKK